MPALPLPNELGPISSLRQDRATLVVALEPATDLAQVERDFAAPAAKALARGIVDAVTLITDGDRPRCAVDGAPEACVATARGGARAARPRGPSRRRADARLMDIVRRTVPTAAGALAAAGVHPVLARVFAARGIETADQLDTDLARLPPFATLKGIAAAAARLADAIAAHEKIVIVADYDADGATACAVGVRGLARDGRRRRLPRSQPLRVRLWPYAGNRRASGGDGAAAHRHRRQRHRQPRRRRRSRRRSASTC